MNPLDAWCARRRAVARRERLADAVGLASMVVAVAPFIYLLHEPPVVYAALAWCVLVAAIGSAIADRIRLLP